MNRRSVFQRILSLLPLPLILKSKVLASVCGTDTHYGEGQRYPGYAKPMTEDEAWAFLVKHNAYTSKIKKISGNKWFRRESIKIDADIYWVEGHFNAPMQALDSAQFLWNMIYGAV